MAQNPDDKLETVNLVKKSKELERKNQERYETETDDSVLKIFVLDQILKTRENFSKYKLEYEKTEMEEKRNIITIIVSLIGLFLIILSISRDLTILTQDKSLLGFLFLYLAMLIFMLYSYFGISYKNTLITEYGSEYIGGYFLAQLIKNFSDTWIVIWGNQDRLFAYPKSKIEQDEKNRQIRIEEEIASIEKGGITKNNEILIKDISDNISKFLDGQIFETTLYLKNHGWAAVDLVKKSSQYSLDYYAYDHTGVIKAYEIVTVKRKYPEMQKNGFYNVRCCLVSIGGGFQLFITKKKFIDLNERIIKEIEGE